MVLLQVKNISKSYQKKPIVSELSFEIHAGEIIGLLGPNGAGKTTAFYLTSGLIRPDHGAVLLNGKNITQLSLDQRALLGMGYLSQEPSVFKSLTVKENILCILELFVPRKDRKKKLEEALEELHLTKIQNKKAALLSGGERRRLEITRVLLSKPSLLLLDEPFANIDPLAIQEVKELIMLLAEKRGIAVLITDHNARELFSIIDRGYLMQEGKLLLTGSVAELISNPLAKSAYLGDGFLL